MSCIACLIYSAEFGLSMVAPVMLADAACDANRIVRLAFLHRRADHAASKYLKNNYRLPKKLEESSLSRLKDKLTRPSVKQPHRTH